MCWAFQLIVLQKGWSSPRTAKWSRDKGSWHAFSWLCHNKPFTCDRNVHIPIHLTVITRLSRAHLSYVPLIPKACSSSARFCWTWNENNQNVVKTHSFWDPKSRKKCCVHAKAFKWTNWTKQGQKSLRAQQLPTELTFHHLQTEPSECDCYLAVKVAAHSFLRPRKMKEICSPLFLWIADHICHDLNTRKSTAISKHRNTN